MREGGFGYLFPDVAGTNAVGLPRLTRQDGLVAGTRWIKDASYILKT